MKQAFINKVSSPRNVVGDLPITWSCHKKDFSLCNTTTQSAEDSRQKHSGMTSFFNVKAFTLIELLVVVLIIGILSAVALPQYQKAVYKARATEAMLMLKAVHEAQERYYLANGSYTSDWSNLDISIPAELIIESEEPTGSLPNSNKYYYRCSEDTCWAMVDNPNMPTFEYNHNHAPKWKGNFWCIFAGSSKQITKTNTAKSICQSMGVLSTDISADWFAGKYFKLN